MPDILSSALTAKLAQIKKDNPVQFQTNCFSIPEQDKIEGIETANSVLFLVPEYDFFRIYFASNDLNDLKEQLPLLIKGKTVCLEILAKEEINPALHEAISSSIPYSTTFERMRAKTQDIRSNTVYDPSCIEYARHDDVSLVYDTLHRLFNKHYSHIQSINTLHEYVDNRQIILPRTPEGEPASFLIYTVSGKTSHNNHGININKDPVYGVKMLDYYKARMTELGMTNIFVWVDAIANKRTQKMHQFYGYKNDGTKNFIFIKQA